MDKLHKRPAERVGQVQVGELVVNIAVQDYDVHAALFCPGHDTAEVDSVQQVKEVAGQSEVPAADILVATVDRLAGSADTALAFIDFVDEALAVFDADDNVVPEGQERGLESGGMQRGAQTVNLGGFT